MPHCTQYLGAQIFSSGQYLSFPRMLLAEVQSHIIILKISKPRALIDLAVAPNSYLCVLPMALQQI
jgi:hypothetical protein